MTASPLTRVSLSDQVLERVREAIICGELAQNAALSEPSLAKRYHVSRAPVREALLALEREGLVTIDGRGRAHVVSLTAKLFEELVAVRIALEGLASRLAAEAGGPKLAEELEAIVGRIAEVESFRELTRLDVAFHEAVVRAAGNDRVLVAWLTARSLIEFWLVSAFLDAELVVPPREMAAKSHRGLMQAITSGKPSRAEKAAVEHINRWRTYLPAK